MKQFITYFLIISLFGGSFAQTTATFESFDLEAEGFLDGSDGSGGFSDGHIFLPNDYNSEFDAWMGWAISNATDTLTPGYTNLSAIAGSGYDGSSNYAVTFALPSSIIHLTGEAAGGSVAGLYVTNSTYAYLSILNGDSFAKKFGGETGDDPDFFLLTIKKYLNGELGADSVDFFLADYRFEDNSQDYIVKDWTYIDLSTLGNADSLQFSLSSSDVGQFGMNTPAYFCMDNLTTLDRTTAVKHYLHDLPFTVFPNPATDQIRFNWMSSGSGQVALFDAAGRRLRAKALAFGENTLFLQDLPPGSYFLRVQSEQGWLSRKLVKQ